MLHLPAGNGSSPRTVHRSKWFGASSFGRKFLEAFICRDSNNYMLCRSSQSEFVTDGVTAERIYRNGASEVYFVPDFIHGLHWTLSAPIPMTLDIYFDMRFQRASSSDHAYAGELDDGCMLVSRPIEMTAGAEAEGPDTGGSAVSVSETLWAACRVDGAEIILRDSQDRWRPMWYSLDAARRRYLRRHAVAPATEHAPLWEMTKEWVYAPASIRFATGGAVSLGFGTSRREAVVACSNLLEQRGDLEREKRARLVDMLKRSHFSTGHEPTDLAYTHVLSRLHDCLVISPGPSERNGPAILAGNAYFQEAWRRDENIALGGLMATGQYESARSIVDSTWRSQDELTGRLPLRNRVGEVSGYTSSDGTLWALLRLAQLIAATGDVDMFQKKLSMIERFFDRSLAASRDGLLPSGGVARSEHHWETWMDTEFSPRAGYPIEIQLLWLSCLETYGNRLAHRSPGLAERIAETAEKLRLSLDRFVKEDHFVDHLDYDLHPVDLLTPNAYFWTILHSRFDWEWEDRSLVLGRRELGGISGVRTLARSQWASVLGPEIAALARSDRPLPSLGKVNYHRGVEWNWLAQLFVAGALRHGQPDMAFDHHLARQLFDCTNTAGLGGISEVFDHRGPAGPDYQAWSMTGLIESLHRFLGVRMDVPTGQIEIRPLKPKRWPFIAARKWYGRHGFDIRYEGGARDQRLSLEFAELPANPPTLNIQLPLRSSEMTRSPRVTVRRENDVDEVIASGVSVETRPPRVVMTIPASSTVIVRLRV